MTTPIWRPGAAAWDVTNLGDFARRFCPQAHGDYEALWRWSVDESTDFWRSIWDYFQIGDERPSEVLRADGPMPAVHWFPSAKINYAELMLRGSGVAPDAVAVTSISQTRDQQLLSLRELRGQVRRVASSLRALGVSRGDRVVAYLPNISETVVAFLATASIGAIWSSCPPEFGVKAVVDRWAQIEPTVLLTIDGYRYGSKDIELHDQITEIRAGLSSVQATVVLPYLPGAAKIPDATQWSALVAGPDSPLTFEQVPFDHPLYILYSSGTTGLPKAIVHGHGGITLEHSKQLGLQMDLGPGDRFFWFSTTGWMMWNYLLSGLLVGASIVLFDGNPSYPSLDRLWALIADTDTTFAGVSAPFIMACRDNAVRPAAQYDLSSLRGIGSTGAPLPESGFSWISSEVGGVHIANISGGTDVCSAFVGSAPVLPVTAGSFPCRQLGWAVDAFDADGTAVREHEGELVITEPAPSMPVAFWGDDGGERYSDAYFSTYRNVWRHGDWITIAADGSCVISGRSDATLNRGGVRIGTADYYDAVESDPAIADSLIVHLEQDGGLGQLVLFVVLTKGFELDDELREHLHSSIRAQLSPRHQPDVIVSMPAVPRTLSGKKLEVPVKRILQGTPVDIAASAGALADPRALDPYVAYATSMH